VRIRYPVQEPVQRRLWSRVEAVPRHAPTKTRPGFMSRMRRQTCVLAEDLHHTGPRRRDGKFALFCTGNFLHDESTVSLRPPGLPSPSRAARFSLVHASPKYLDWIPAVLQGCGRGGAEVRSGLCVQSRLGLTVLLPRDIDTRSR
jgi:hypothetical protein